MPTSSSLAAPLRLHLVPLSVFYDSSAEMPGPSIEGKPDTFVNILFDGENQLTSLMSKVCQLTVI